MNPYFKPVALEHASRLINHGPTVLVTSAHGSARNIMAAAWSMPVEFTPPRIAIVIDKATYKDPIQFPKGIEYVIVNGTITVENGVHTGKRAGKVLKHN